MKLPVFIECGVKDVFCGEDIFIPTNLRKSQCELIEGV